MAIDHLSSFGTQCHTGDSFESLETPTERCSVCILPRTTKGLSFDDSSICSLCRAQQATGHTADSALRCHGSIDDEIERIRERGRSSKYDCLVGLSGGRDSSYLLYLLVQKHKLRCIAAHYRTPFTDDVIEENVEKTVSRLNVPLVRIDLSRQFHRDFARKILLILRKRPVPELVHLVCAPCKSVHRAFFEIARANNVKSVVCGGNKTETFQFGATSIPKRLGRHELYFRAQAMKGLSALGRGVSLLVRHPRLIQYVPTGLKSILYLNPHTVYLRVRFPDISRVDYFFHEECDEAECTRLITSELGWTLPPGCNSYWRADCSMAEVKNLLFRRLVGASYMDAYLSNKVRFGEISRKEALARLETEGKVSQHRLLHVARVLGLPSNVFEPFRQSMD